MRLDRSSKYWFVGCSLIREGVLAARCSNCLLSNWLGLAIPLELDHRDGDKTNNELANLRLLCPNCHALTPTYRGRNIRNKRLSESRNITPEARVVKLGDTGDLAVLSPCGEIHTV